MNLQMFAAEITFLQAGVAARCHKQSQFDIWIIEQMVMNSQGLCAQ